MRLEPVSPADLSAEQRPLYESMKAGVGQKFSSGFQTMRPDGALLGPWNAWLHDPAMGTAFWDVTETMTREQRIPDAARQVAILATGAHFNAAFELYAHAAVARSKDQMSDRRLATLSAGERPEDLTDEEAAAFDTASALLSRGPLPDELYNRCLKLFGTLGTSELIFLVGHYCFVSLTLNGFAIPVPTGS